MENIQKSSFESSYEILGSDDGKIMMKFPFLEVPVEVDYNYFHKYFEC